MRTKQKSKTVANPNTDLSSVLKTQECMVNNKKEDNMTVKDGFSLLLNLKLPTLLGIFDLI